MYKEQLIADILLLPPTAIEYHMSKNLAALFPEKALIESDGICDIESFADAGQCTLTRKTFIVNQMNTFWRAPEPQLMHWRHMGMPGMMPLMGGMAFEAAGPLQGDNGTDSSAQQETVDRVKNAWLEVNWQGHTLDVIVLHISGFNMQSTHHWILAENEEIARAFLAAACRWNMEIRSEVLVFDNGHWYKDVHLFHDIKGATFDNLILRGDLKQEIRNDLTQFFASREIYEEHDIPWKRGILFVGPAGNGKTHAVKALINSLDQPCLYVKSFRSPHTHGADEFNIRQVFDRARRTAPCLLILEDLDSLITPQNRSFFLNELDGFAANIGIVALATTNHPERLDPSILNRPSRFDRKYPFDLPELPERRAYITMWNESLKPGLRLSAEGVEQISRLTEGFSFAYLKELFLSSKMRWIANPVQGSMEEVMVGQVHSLREQMVSAASFAVSGPADDSPASGGAFFFGPGVSFTDS
ncbi:MAG: ATP-binding protein [Ktedonobacteraceae bacterium]|nr:ATP-binding protein [Ktedonobacteraceae bacterium]